MTQKQARLLLFAIKYKGWQSYDPDVVRTIYSLEQHGLLEVNEHKQFRLRQYKLNDVNAVEFAGATK